MPACNPILALGWSALVLFSACTLQGCDLPPPDNRPVHYGHYAGYGYDECRCQGQCVRSPSYCPSCSYLELSGQGHHDAGANHNVAVTILSEGQAESKQPKTEQSGVSEEEKGEEQGEELEEELEEEQDEQAEEAEEDRAVAAENNTVNGSATELLFFGSRRRVSPSPSPGPSFSLFRRRRTSPPGGFSLLRRRRTSPSGGLSLFRRRRTYSSTDLRRRRTPSPGYGPGYPGGCTRDCCMGQSGYGGGHTPAGPSCRPPQAGHCPMAMNTGAVGSCMVGSCSSSRGPTYCSHGTCYCEPGYCRYPASTVHVQSRRCRALVPHSSCHLTRTCWKGGLMSSSCVKGACMCRSHMHIGCDGSCHAGWSPVAMSSMPNQTLAEEGSPEFDQEENLEIAMNVAIFAAWVAACTALAAGMGAFAWRKLRRLEQSRSSLLATEPDPEYKELPGSMIE